ncbi:hypothetical protein V8Z80_10820 [Orrella sp. JC864]|uniref:hypothetical protein n=1 Tax=Orrella sp. JC864 TaxID=3120298 RepID=UPI00300ADA09
MPADSPRRPRNKTVAALLALLLGWAGAHWWYMGRRHAWLPSAWALLCIVLAFSCFEIWWENPAAFLLLVPAVDGYVRAAVYGLTADERFDARYNPGLGRVTHTGFGTIAVVIATVLVAAIVVLTTIAVAVLYTWQQLGWLDGYVL